MRSVKPVKISCSTCNVQSRPVKPSSPAAPTLTALEVLEADGWSYSLGFTSMLTGNYHPRCPDCSRSS